MKRALKHGIADVDSVRATLNGAYKANASRLSPYSPKMVWKGAREATVVVTVMSRPIVTDFTITDEEVLVDSRIPFVFSHFEQRIMNVLFEELETWFSKARSSIA
jgi:hypothetical protein